MKKNLNTINKIVLFSILMILFFVNNLYADVPNIFTNGNVADADEVNANFEFLDDAIETRWDLNGTNLYYNDGNVGIGTTAPGTYHLNIYAESSETDLLNLHSADDSGQDLSFQYSDSDNSWKLTTNDGTSLDFVIDGSNASINLEGEDGNNFALVFKTSSDSWEGAIQRADTLGGMAFYASDNLSIPFFIKDDNNVGIGTTTPGVYKLYVEGDAYTTGTWGSSDIRFKKNITSLKGSLKKVLKLKGVNFKWKTEEYSEKGFNDKKQVGFIAQDVEKVIPELVKTDDDGYKSVSYSKITAVLVEAIKELKIQNEALKKEILEIKKILKNNQ